MAVFFTAMLAMTAALSLTAVQSVMAHTTMTATACNAADDPDDDDPHAGFRLRAMLSDDQPLEVGETAHLQVALSLPEGWSASASGLPQAVLQIGVPESVQLEGRVLTDHRELAENGFLQAPFERLLEDGSAAVAFTFVAAPGADDRIAVNVVAYVQPGEDSADARFIRRRVELPVRPGADVSSPVQAEASTWGIEEATGLQLGERAKSFTLPRADGTTLNLADHLGKRNIILVTYRAHW